MRVPHRMMGLTGWGQMIFCLTVPKSVIRENRRISGSPPGVPPPDIFPSKIKLQLQSCLGNQADKMLRSGENGEEDGV
jgi:hypothetical protein